MLDGPPRFARLDASLIRRQDASWSDCAASQELPAGDAAAWRSDLRLFLTAWAAGFAFFLAFLL